MPQGSVLASVLYTLYTHDLPQSDFTYTATYADDTVVLSSHEDKRGQLSITFSKTFEKLNSSDFHFEKKENYYQIGKHYHKLQMSNIKDYI